MLKINVYKLSSFLLILCICLGLNLFIIVKANNEAKHFLFGRVIYVDAGHGGNDNGANFDGVLEDEINLKISGYLVENLLSLGSYVLVSRTGDYDLSKIYDKNKKRNDLINRVNRINSSKAEVFISIHLNSYTSNYIRGGQVFYQNNTNSNNLAKSIQNKLNFISSNKGRIEKKGDYYILNKSNRVGVLVECGFLSNDEERELLSNDLYQQKIANQITLGIIDYFDNFVN